MLKKYFISEGADKKQAIVDLIFSVLYLIMAGISLVFFFFAYPYLFGFAELNFKFLEPLILKEVLIGMIYTFYIVGSLSFRVRVLKYKKATLSYEHIFVAILCLLLQAYFILSFKS